MQEIWYWNVVRKCFSLVIKDNDREIRLVKTEQWKEPLKLAIDF